MANLLNLQAHAHAHAHAQAQAHAMHHLYPGGPFHGHSLHISREADAVPMVGPSSKRGEDDGLRGINGLVCSLLPCCFKMSSLFNISQCLCGVQYDQRGMGAHSSKQMAHEHMGPNGARARPREQGPQAKTLNIRDGQSRRRSWQGDRMAEAQEIQRLGEMRREQERLMYKDMQPPPHAGSGHESDDEKNEYLQLQSEADNSLLDTVARCRDGTRSPQQLQDALKICELANEKVHMTNQLMDAWRQKLCAEINPDDRRHLAFAGR
eukprot:scaffold648053_cov51-Prasinocladus_malaysianus.AAC.1